MTAYNDNGTGEVGMVTAFLKNSYLPSGAFNPSALANASPESNALTLDLQNIQTEAPRNALAIINAQAVEGLHFVTDLSAARMTAIRGYFDETFATKSHQGTLCVGDIGSYETCITKEQLDTLLVSTGNIPGLTIQSVGSIKDALAINSDAIFFGRPYFNADTAGFAVVAKGAMAVKVKYDAAYLDKPIVNASITMDRIDGQTTDLAKVNRLFTSAVRYVIVDQGADGFTIMLSMPAPDDMQFSWNALAVKDAKTFTSDQNTEDLGNLNVPSAPPVVAADPDPIAEPITPVVVAPVEVTPPTVGDSSQLTNVTPVAGDQTAPLASPSTTVSDGSTAPVAVTPADNVAPASDPTASPAVSVIAPDPVVSVATPTVADAVATEPTPQPAS
jgi:hypothetical protein